MTKHPQIISLSAPRPQSGKDTLAQLLINHYGKDQVATIAFGDYLRDCVAHLFEMPYRQEIRERLNDSRKDIVLSMCRGTAIVHNEYREFLLSGLGVNLHEYQTPRFHMQHFGNDFIKGHMGLDSFWVDVVDRRIAWLMRTNPNLKLIIVTDTRSPNEFQWLKEQGAKFVMVERVGFPKDAHDDKTNAHPVELHAENWKYDLKVWNHFGYRDQLLSSDLLNLIDSFN